MAEAGVTPLLAGRVQTDRGLGHPLRRAEDDLDQAGVGVLLDVLVRGGHDQIGVTVPVHVGRAQYLTEPVPRFRGAGNTGRALVDPRARTGVHTARPTGNHRDVTAAYTVATDPFGSADEQGRVAVTVHIVGKSGSSMSGAGHRGKEQRCASNQGGDCNARRKIFPRCTP